MTAIGNCQRCNSLVEKGDLRCAVCAFVLPVAKQARQEVVTQIMRCEECGAAVSYDPNAQAPRCAFCDSTMHIEAIEDPMEQTELFLPFQVGPDQAKGTVREWLGSLGFFRPSDLKSEARIDTVKPLYWVGWLFRADALISWTADSNAGAGRAAWAPHAGQQPMVFENVVVSASRGLKEKEVAFLTDSYNLMTAGPQPYGPPGHVIEQFDVQRSEARAKISAAIENTAKGRVQAGNIPGSRFRKVQVSPLLKGLTTSRFAFPAYVMAYHYGGKPYRAVVSAHDATRITGTAPLSWLKIIGLILGIAAIIAIIVAIVTAS
jgi:hypothetical protein